MASCPGIDPSPRHSRAVFGLLALLAVTAYLPTLWQPFISDDFVTIIQSRRLATSAGWVTHLSDPVNCFRTTLLLLTHGLDRAFGPTPLPFYGAAILIHFLNACLVFALGTWREVGWRVSTAAALFFVIYEGHQEAVMWYTATLQSLVILFSALALVGWIHWIQEEHAHPGWYGLVLAGTALALFSKESAVVLPLLLALPAALHRPAWRKAVPALVPIILMVLAAMAWLWQGRAGNWRLADGSFSLQAPWLATLLWSIARMAWFWGLAALAVLVACRPPQWGRRLLLAIGWIILSLLPFSFLTYMDHVPSRHVYGASIGLSWIVGMAFVCLADRWGEKHRVWIGALAAVIVIHNAGYLWTKKRAQFLDRAACTEALVRSARQAKGPVRVERFPYLPVVASSAVEVELGKAAPPLVFELSGEPSRGPLDYRYVPLPPEGIPSN
jgi:hypothetical protein